jgi:hypothetical protein
VPVRATLSRLENSVGPRDLYRVAETLVEVFIGSHRGERVKRIILDADGTDDPAHGQQEFEFFNGYYGCHCFLPLLVFATVETDGGPARSSGREQELVCALLRTGKAAPGHKALALLKRLVKRLKVAFPEAEIVFRGDSGFALPALYDYLDEAGVSYAVAMGKNSVLETRTEPYLLKALEQRAETGEPSREFAAFTYQAKGWKHERRVVVKAEVLLDKENPRYVVTNLADDPEAVYGFYTERGDAENRIKEMKDDLFSGRTSCHRFFGKPVPVVVARGRPRSDPGCAAKPGVVRDGKIPGRQPTMQDVQSGGSGGGDHTADSHSPADELSVATHLVAFVGAASARIRVSRNVSKYLRNPVWEPVRMPWRADFVRNDGLPITSTCKALQSAVIKEARHASSR